MYKKYIKRSLDFFFAAVGLVFITPFLLSLIIILLFSNKGFPFFFQIRNGLKGKEFKIIKLKTMNDKRDSEGFLLPDIKRVTIMGKFIRKYSLDELPQLINVLIGDMSFIGPRPLLPEYMPLYTSEQIKRHNVRPGITGWAQINGRNTISWTAKFNYDVWYVENLSLLLDLKIFLITLKKVFFSEGINISENKTMPPFTGNN